MNIKEVYISIIFNLNLFPESGIKIHPSNEIYSFNFKEYYPDFGSTVDYIIQIDGVNLDPENCFDWFKGLETGTFLIYMPV